jgi:hypothetical protein
VARTQRQVREQVAEHVLDALWAPMMERLASLLPLCVDFVAAADRELRADDLRAIGVHPSGANRAPAAATARHDAGFKPATLRGPPPPPPAAVRIGVGSGSDLQAAMVIQRVGRTGSAESIQEEVAEPTDVAAAGRGAPFGGWHNAERFQRNPSYKRLEAATRQSMLAPAPPPAKPAGGGGQRTRVLSANVFSVRGRKVVTTASDPMPSPPPPPPQRSSQRFDPPVLQPNVSVAKLLADILREPRDEPRQSSGGGGGGMRPTTSHETSPPGKQQRSLRLPPVKGQALSSEREDDWEGTDPWTAREIAPLRRESATYVPSGLRPSPRDQRSVSLSARPRALSLAPSASAEGGALPLRSGSTLAVHQQQQSHQQQQQQQQTARRLQGGVSQRDWLRSTATARRPVTRQEKLGL